ncbi:hypothetical protein [Pseudodesulfovibrio methanolicus]|uniref:4Fe-4S ferredoxin-type domain-containing protein n=1 Tax=Pseudodesulfovibrio methanolicus TaxID=3126690 RepID=A0ABZ2IZA1_9BACT
MSFITQGLRRMDARAAAAMLLDRVHVLLVRPVAASRVFLHATGKARRFYLVHFRKDYVRAQLRAREGACRQCGFCCNMLFTCPLLTREGRCVAYGVCRPRSCRVFPIDQRDIDEVGKCGARCGYRFENRR